MSVRGAVYFFLVLGMGILFEMIEAAKYGDLTKITQLRNNGCDWDESVIATAAKHGNFYVLKYLHEHGCKWDEQTTSGAAAYRHFHIVKYAHENGCPWDVKTPEAAARSGYLRILKYAHTNECPWDRMTPIRAAFNGHWNTVFYYAHIEGVEKTCHDIETCQWARIGDDTCLKNEFRKRWFRIYLYRIGLILLLEQCKRRFKERYYAPNGNGAGHASKRFKSSYLE